MHNTRSTRLVKMTRLEKKKKKKTINLYIPTYSITFKAPSNLIKSKGKFVEQPYTAKISKVRAFLVF